MSKRSLFDLKFLNSNVTLSTSFAVYISFFKVQSWTNSLNFCCAKPHMHKIYLFYITYVTIVIWANYISLVLLLILLITWKKLWRQSNITLKYVYIGILITTWHLHVWKNWDFECCKYASFVQSKIIELGNFTDS